MLSEKWQIFTSKSDRSGFTNIVTIGKINMEIFDAAAAIKVNIYKKEGIDKIWMREQESK